MQEESIEEAIRITVDNIQYSNINIVDKVELLMNITKFLDDYENNIKILNKERVKKKCYG